MKVLILGIDGYLGHSLALHLLSRGDEVSGVDCYLRRIRVNKIGSDSLTPILSVSGRASLLGKLGLSGLYFIELGEDSYEEIVNMLDAVQPDAIVHLAEQPSAGWSMKDVESCYITQKQNVCGTLDLLWAMREVCPQAHLLKLGTMGEYGTPNCDIPEGEVPRPCISGHYEGIPPQSVPCRMAGLAFPRSAGSFYHLSKVHDTHNIIFACKTWNLRSTDIMQGVVFGLNETDKTEELTRFDYDEYFGTVINRFCVQALIGHPLTVYGKGGQTRGYLPLKDSLQCMALALDNSPAQGEYRTLNQFESTYSVRELAYLVTECAKDLNLKVAPGPIDNPRLEMEEHYYNPQHQKLFDMGYIPMTDIKKEVTTLIERLIPYSFRVRPEVILPKTTWR